jgi:hypothetical protein
MATDTVIRKSIMGSPVEHRTRAFARVWARGQAVGWYMFAALLHSAAFLPGGDMGIIGLYLLSLLALAGGHVVTTACLTHLRDIERRADRGEQRTAPAG